MNARLALLLARLGLSVCLAACGLVHAQEAAAQGGAAAEEDSAKSIQRERLQILMQERSKTALELSSVAGSPAGPEGAEEHSARVRRLQSDLRAIEAEIVRVGRAPAPVTRDTGMSAHEARQPAVARAAGSASASAASDGIAYEGWDVFKNFGKQGSK